MAKYYVYHLIDPRNDEVFYVGKGSGNRIDQHESDARNFVFKNAEKEYRIHQIWNDGFEVIKLKVKNFNSESLAFKFEKDEIDRFGLDNLTNISKGFETEDFKSLRKAQAFILQLSRLKAVKPNLQYIDTLISEMNENISMITASLGDEYVST